MEQNKKDDKKPAVPIPTLKDSKSVPQLKIKGLAQGGLSLMERLKAFKKKDLAFILAGLGVLFLAPLAEHFMMAPDGDQGMTAGFGSHAGEGGPFGGGKGPYEGNGVGAPGGPIGNGSDVITPLNVRDPAALVMGPGATQQPPAASTTPPPAAPTKSDGDWKDALKESAARAATAAAPKAALPVPKIPLSAGGLRGLGAVSGGGGGSYTLPPINANSVPNHGNLSSSPGAIAGSGYRGPARSLGQGGDQSSLEALKKAADAAGGKFNGPGSAASNLEQAASQAMPSGSAEGGDGQGGGGGDKASGQSGDKSSKNADGQSLAFLKAKQEQEKAIEFEWKKKEAADTDLMWYKIRDKMAEELVMTPLKAITAGLAKTLSKLGTSSSDQLNCTPAGVTDPSAIRNGLTQVNVDDIQSCSTAPSKDTTEAGGDQFYAWGKDYTHVWSDRSACGDQSKGLICNGPGDKNAPGPAPDNGSITDIKGGVFNPGSYDTICNSLVTLSRPVAGAKANDAVLTAVTPLKDATAALASVNAALTTGNSTPEAAACGATAVTGAGSGGASAIPNQLGTVGSTANTTYASLNDAYTKMLAAQKRAEWSTRAVLGTTGTPPATNPGTDPGSTPLGKNVEIVRGYFGATSGDYSSPDKNPNTAVWGDAGLGGVKKTLDGADNTQKFNGDAAQDTITSGVNGVSLSDIRAKLAVAEGSINDSYQRLTAASGKLTTAAGAVQTLSATDAKNGSTYQGYLTALQNNYTNLTAQLGTQAAEYNRQAGANGVLKLENDLLTGDKTIRTLDSSVRRDIAGPDSNPNTWPGFFKAMQGVAGATPGDLPTTLDSSHQPPVARKTAFTNAAGPQTTTQSPFLQPHVTDAAGENDAATKLQAVNTALAPQQSALPAATGTSVSDPVPATAAGAAGASTP